MFPNNIRQCVHIPILLNTIAVFKRLILLFWFFNVEGLPADQIGLKFAYKEENGPPFNHSPVSNLSIFTGITSVGYIARLEYSDKQQDNKNYWYFG